MLSMEDIDLITSISQAGTFSKAADRLFITQSTLSKRIISLEQQLGYRIFLRRRGQKQIELTAQGASLLHIATQIYQLQYAAMDLKYLEERKTLAIASSDGPYLLVVDAAVQRLYQEDSRWMFRLYTKPYKACVNAVATGHADIAFIGGDEFHTKNVHIAPLYQENMVFVQLQSNMRLDPSRIQELDLSHMVFSPYSFAFMEWYKETFQTRSAAIYCELIDEVAFYLKNLNFWSIVPASVARHLSLDLDLNIVPLPESVPGRVVYYAVRKKAKNENVTRLLSMMRSILETQNDVHILQ